MILYLIRHAQSENNHLENWFTRDRNPAGKSLVRKSDPSLTEIGFAQADHLARHLATVVDKPDLRDRIPASSGYRIEKLFCSPMKRAIQTAHAVAREMNIQPELCMDVFEEGGVWLQDSEIGEKVGKRGMSRSEMTAQFPKLKLAPEVKDDGWWFGSFETRDEMKLRVARVARQIQQDAEKSNDVVAIVSHGTFIIYLLHALTNQVDGSSVAFSHQNTGITRLDFADDNLRVRYANQLEHLPPSLVV